MSGLRCSITNNAAVAERERPTEQWNRTFDFPWQNSNTAGKNLAMLASGRVTHWHVQAAAEHLIVAHTWH